MNNLKIQRIEMPELGTFFIPAITHDQKPRLSCLQNIVTATSPRSPPVSVDRLSLRLIANLPLQISTGKRDFQKTGGPSYCHHAKDVATAIPTAPLPT